MRIDPEEPYHPTSALIMSVLCPIVWQSYRDVCKTIWHMNDGDYAGISVESIRATLNLLRKTGRIVQEIRSGYHGRIMSGKPVFAVYRLPVKHHPVRRA